MSQEFYHLVRPEGITRGREPAWERFARTTAIMKQLLYKVWGDIRVESFGTWLGQTWLILEPLLQTLKFYILIRVIFGAGSDDSSFVALMTVITFWQTHSNITCGAAPLLLGRSAAFIEAGIPLSALFFELVAHETVQMLFRIALLLLAMLALGHSITWNYLYIIPIGITMLVFSVSIALWVSVAGVLVRDFNRFFSYFVSLWFYFSPGLYKLERLPPKFQAVAAYNPFAPIMEGLRASVIYNQAPDMASIGYILLLSLPIFYGGLRMVERAKFRLFSHL